MVDCQFLGGLPPGKILSRRLSSVRRDRGKKILKGCGSFHKNIRNYNIPKEIT
jgi:hypothetical protein